MWGKANYFSDAPYLTEDAAQWIVEKGVILVAIDFQTDKPRDVTYPVHKKLLGNGVVIVEYITNAEKISKQKVKLLALPLKISDCEASPARVVVIEE